MNRLRWWLIRRLLPPGHTVYRPFTREEEERDNW